MADAWLPRERYIALRHELRVAATELARIELACVLAVAFIFAWLARDSGGYAGYQGLVWLVPILVPAFGLLKARAIQAHMRRLRDELAGLEAAAAVEGQGRPEPSGSLPGGGTGIAMPAWILFLLLTIAGSALGFMDYREQCPGPLSHACIQDDTSDAPDDGT
jgi:hypothetical protein